MKNYSQDIMDYAALHSDFGLHDLYAHLDGEADISRQTVSWYLTKLTESGQLRRIGHGKYAKADKQQFAIVPTDDQQQLNEMLKQHWPFAHIQSFEGRGTDGLSASYTRSYI